MSFMIRMRVPGIFIVVLFLLSGCGGGSGGNGGGGGGGQVTVPSAPTGLAATAGNTQVSLTWNASSGATSYNVQRSTTSGGPYTQIGTPTATNYTDTGLTDGTTYYYVVAAANSAGTSANSTQASATPNAAPPVPTGLTATAGNAQVALAWNASTGAASYKVQRSTTSGGPYTQIGTPTAANYTNTGLTNGTTYYYVVAAVNAAGTSANSAQVSATPTAPAVAVTPNPASATIGSQMQFSAAINGTASSAVTWSVAAPSGSSLSPGTISTSGLYTTPYPAPATVTVTATSTSGVTSGMSGSTTVTLTQPAAAAGPALTVNASTSGQTHAISPYIYGMSFGTSNLAEAAAFSLPIDRWGGNEATSYNYLYDLDAKGSDWYFENFIDNSNPINTPSGAPNTSGFNTQVENDAAVGAKSLGTVPIIGWVPADNSACSFSVAKYGAQQAVNPNRTDCGNGILINGNKVVNDPTDTYYKVDPPTFDSTWVSFLVNKFGKAANGGVAIYELDNEPSWWDGVHIDVHPLPFTYDELTNTSIATAEAVKNADPTAGVSGPVMDYWWDYFYSKKDVESGWGSGGGPCWQPWSNPVDREAHGGVPLIEYYLQQFAAASNTYGARLLDYLDLHTYYAATYNGNGVAFSTAGDTGEQQARLNSTRVFWDPTYTDPNEPQPNYVTDPNYTSSCNVPLQAPQLIPMVQAWVARDYPGTKVAFTEYNWGGQEHINGALAQADILGIFGMYGLDLATLWGTPDPTTQVPGLMAYEIYRNYDGNKSMFGDTALASATGNQGILSVYGALRSADNAVTVVVINKTYGDLTSTLSIQGLATTTTSAQAYLYSNANLAAIVAQPTATVTPGSAGAASTIANYTFPAQSITLFVVPN